MALCEELNLYKETTYLLNMVIPLSQSFPRFFRYNIGNRMLDLILDMMSLIYQANGSYEKAGPLTEFLNKYQMLRTLFRVCVEQRIITERQYATFALQMDKVGKQATGWRQYSEKKEKNK